MFENVAFPLREKTALPEGEIREKVRGILQKVGLEKAEEKFPDELSGGMVRRAALARAVVMDPEIILFDEPTTGLDPIIRNSILNLICRTYHEHHFTMVMIRHDLQGDAKKAQRRGLLRKELFPYFNFEEMTKQLKETVRKQSGA